MKSQLSLRLHPLLKVCKLFIVLVASELCGSSTWLMINNQTCYAHATVKLEFEESKSICTLLGGEFLDEQQSIGIFTQEMFYPR